MSTMQSKADDKIEPFNFGQPSRMIFSKIWEGKKITGHSIANCRNFRIPILRWASKSFRTGNDRVSRANTTQNFTHFKLQVTFLPTWAKNTSRVALAILKSQTDWHVIQFFVHLPIFHTVWNYFKIHFSRVKVENKFKKWKMWILKKWEFWKNGEKI